MNNINKIIMTVVYTTTLLLSMNAQANRMELQERLAKIQSFSANFIQKIVNDKGKVIIENEGKLVIQRPNLLHWQVAEPEDIMMRSNGSTLWLYDTALEQVTLYNAVTMLEQTPFLLLTTADASIWSNYDVQQQNNHFIVKNKEQKTIKQLELTIDNYSLKALTFIDANNQKTEYQFTQQQYNKPIVNTFFEFTIPENIEIDDQR